MNDLLRRQAAVDATLAKYRKRAVDFKTADCIRLARFHLLQMGHKPPPLPQYHVEDEPTVVFGGRAPRARGPGSTREPRISSEGRDAPDSAPASREQDDPAFTNVFLNVGRRDGLRPEDVQRLVVDRAGVAESDVGHIRLRDRITFVGIRKEHAEQAIKALIGAVVGDRILNAELARDR